MAQPSMSIDDIDPQHKAQVSQFMNPDGSINIDDIPLDKKLDMIKSGVLPASSLPPTNVSVSVGVQPSDPRLATLPSAVADEIRRHSQSGELHLPSVSESVLREMKDKGFITEEQLNAALTEKAKEASIDSSYQELVN